MLENTPFLKKFFVLLLWSGNECRLEGTQLPALRMENVNSSKSNSLKGKSNIPQLNKRQK